MADVIVFLFGVSLIMFGSNLCALVYFDYLKRRKK